MSERVASHRELSIDDAPKIAAAVSQLAKVGLKPFVPEQEFAEVAHRKLDELEGIHIPYPALPLTWLHLALVGSEQVFANAVYFQDHCYDGAGEGDYAQVVASITALAGEEWPSATISAAGVIREGQFGPSRRVEMAISGQGQCAPFDLIADKNFDWSVVTRLNERLPAEATGRFAAFFDGNATIVYLRPDQLAELSRLFGHDFMSEIDPLPERPPPTRLDEVPVRRPVPYWALPICFLMGLYATGELIAMIARGAPYSIPGRHLTPIFFANAPLEFVGAVTVNIVGVALFLGGPVYLLAKRWRERQERRRDAVDASISG